MKENSRLARHQRFNGYGVLHITPRAVKGNWERFKINTNK